ncbi:MAG: ethylbenzene dehydrogenase-related protein [Armatimonadota bacterium]|nr:ethylbenzene dehydrogenase-related protein [Armatimonadota bacterium]MDR7445099.1 ethylbenzene dehydrogenase-related protein [Armatimonadota bacterium]MDR7569883.1 ethylbenzene dehydrogenase-related protein [Armatimonadota bacterium]MDR7614184.1 ethylbenzene dehydrogenase-related protein [Armatimonadota bacterium]
MGERKLTRREVLMGLVGLGTIALSEPVQAQPAQQAALLSVRIPSPVPVDPEAEVWRRARTVEIGLLGQAMVHPFKMRPSVPSVQARSLHDGERIAFLVEWRDPRPDRRTVKTREFKDGCAVMLLPGEAGSTEWMMGTPKMPVTVLHWRADWQLDLDQGFQDLEAAFPNVAFDFYPPLVGVDRPKLPEGYPAEARRWLPGWYAGNPLSQPGKRSPVEKLVAQGAGTLEQLPTQNATGRGVWRDGRWRVVLSKPLRATDARELTLAPGGTYAVAFAVWQGATGDRGARKSITLLNRLRLAP